MKFDIITIFSQIFDSYFSESILKRAQKNNLIEIKTHDLRQWTTDKHKSVDDSPYGGGAGMVMMVEPIYKAVKEIFACHPGLPPRLARSSGETGDPGSTPQMRGRLRGNDSKGLLLKKKKIKTRIILFSAKGKPYTQADARRLTQYDQIIMICGRYEGVDERVVEHIADEELSVGNFVLTGGEIPAMIVVDTVSRLIQGVLGKAESLNEESFSFNPPPPLLKGGAGKLGLELETDKLKTENWFLEYPQYTRPEDFHGWKVPEVLLSGNHKKIQGWRGNNSKRKTQKSKL